MLEKIMSGDRTFTATPVALPTDYKPYGELFEDFYVVPVQKDDGTIKNHFVQTGKFFIREYTYNDYARVGYNDIQIDPETLEDVTDPMNPIFVGLDLAREIDSTYYNGEYYCADKH